MQIITNNDDQTNTDTTIPTTPQSTTTTTTDDDQQHFVSTIWCLDFIRSRDDETLNPTHLFEINMLQLREETIQARRQLLIQQRQIETDRQLAITLQHHREAKAAEQLVNIPEQQRPTRGQKRALRQQLQRFATAIYKPMTRDQADILLQTLSNITDEDLQIQTSIATSSTTTTPVPMTTPHQLNMITDLTPEFAKVHLTGIEGRYFCATCINKALDIAVRTNTDFDIKCFRPNICPYSPSINTSTIRRLRFIKQLLTKQGYNHNETCKILRLTQEQNTATKLIQQLLQNQKQE